MAAHVFQSYTLVHFSKIAVYATNFRGDPIQVCGIHVLDSCAEDDILVRNQLARWTFLKLWSGCVRQRRMLWYRSATKIA